jgi:AbrB family looped-hinge helix DNA binding protein
MSIVTTSAKCQVVIPKKEREKVGIKPGTKVIAKAVEDHIEIRPLPENPVESFSDQSFVKGTEKGPPP